MYRYSENPGGLNLLVPYLRSVQRKLYLLRLLSLRFKHNNNHQLYLNCGLRCTNLNSYKQPVGTCKETVLSSVRWDLNGYII